MAVANRSLESSRRAAEELGIPRAYASWEELLDAGLHVLCQARMANDAAEAREMLAASQRHPELVCQLVPSSGTYRIDRALQRLLGEGFVGEILSVEVEMLQRGFANFAGELDWRHDPEFSGIDVLNVGGIAWWKFCANRIALDCVATREPRAAQPDGEPVMRRGPFGSVRDRTSRTQPTGMYSRRCRKVLVAALARKRCAKPRARARRRDASGS